MFRLLDRRGLRELVLLELLFLLLLVAGTVIKTSLRAKHSRVGPLAGEWLRGGLQLPESR